MQALRRACRHSAVALAAASLLSTPAFAHPGSGIGVDKDGTVYFLDTGSGLWKIDAHGKLTKLSETRFHWLAIDVRNQLAKTTLPSGSLGEIVRVGASPTLLLSSDAPIALGQDGSLYSQSGLPGGLQIMRMSPSGATAALATLPATANGPLPHINGATGGRDQSVYYTENGAIRRITANGVVSTVATVPALAGGPSIPGIAGDSRPLLRGLEVDANGVMYVACAGDGRVLKITPDGKITTLLQTQSPWSPTGVALLGGDVYVLEFLHTARDVRSDWLPRVRKIAADGEEAILATIDQMPGARATLPHKPRPVQKLKADVQGSGECRLEWKAAAAVPVAPLAAVSHYRIERRTRKSAGPQTEDWGVWSLTSTDTNTTVKGLERGLEYDFRVFAVNAGGSSGPSEVVTAVLR